MANNSQTPFPRRRATDQQLSIIEWQLLGLAYKNLPAMLIVNVTATLGAGFVLYSNGFSKIVYWMILVLSISAVRLMIWIGFKRIESATTGPDMSTVNRWKWPFATGLYLAAILWIYVVYTSFNFASYPSKFTLVIIISALAGGATGMTAPLKYVGKIYISILLVCTSFILFFTSENALIISLLGLIFWLAMLSSHKNNHQILRQGLTLQLENNQLINSLQELNADLELRVNQRTQALKRIAHHDSLTGLPNRRGLIEWMENNLDQHSSDEAAILFLDLDRFKQINDALGHDVGDQVLQTIAYRFNEICPEDAILGRWGGDEFLLITPQMHNTRLQADQLAKELIKAATAPLEMNNEMLGLGLSVGIAYFPTDALSYKDVIHAADLTVAEVKRSGRGQTLVYNDTYAETQRRRFDLSRSLSDAIAQDHLHLVLQPIVDAKSGNIQAFEVLARWNHPILGEIDPEEFIHLAEDTDRITAMGDWVMRKACQLALNWGAEFSHIKISINVSIKQLLTKDFSKKTLHLLTETKFPAERMIIEVTETLFGDEYLDHTLATVTEIRSAGIHIHIDDFGKGYSSLSRLHQFPVNAIKIDRSFISELDNQGLVIVESAIMIAKRMNLDVIAEGVETLDQIKALHKLGVNALQGFYFSKPLENPMLEAFKTDWIE
jgi:diguanylate cyclase